MKRILTIALITAALAIPTLGLAQTVTVTDPNGDSWLQGASETIKWEYTGDEPEYFEIAWGHHNTYEIIARVDGDVREYDWTVLSMFGLYCESFGSLINITAKVSGGYSGASGSLYCVCSCP